MFRVVEKFCSINGEARRAGELAVFIRFAGCNLRCGYCDTLYAITEDAVYTDESLEELIAYVESTGIVNVTLTGGEPLLQEGIERLTEELLKKGHRVEIETNGAVSIQSVCSLRENPQFRERLTVTLDYKCPSSGMEGYMLMDNYQWLAPNDTVKFVVGSIRDLDSAREIIEEYNLTERCAAYIGVVFGSITNAEVVDYMLRYKMNNVVHQLQQHKYIWEPDARGV